MFQNNSSDFPWFLQASCGCRGQNSTRLQVCVQQNQKQLSDHPPLPIFPVSMHFLSHWNQAEYAARKSVCSQGFSSSAEIIILNFTQRKWSSGELLDVLPFIPQCWKLPCKADFITFAMRSKRSWIVLGPANVLMQHLASLIFQPFSLTELQHQEPWASLSRELKTCLNPAGAKWPQLSQKSPTFSDFNLLSFFSWLLLQEFAQMRHKEWEQIVCRWDKSEREFPA